MTSKPNVKTSLNLYSQAEKLIPGKTQLISRRASSHAYPVSPIYAKHAKGSKFTDVDGNQYIDWINAVTAVILGHSDDVVDDAVKNQIDKGSIYTLNSPLEIELAELLNQEIPSSEMVRYTKGGGDACAVAIRIARGVTGKDKIIISGYHGWHDWYQAANFGADPVTGEFPFAGIEPIGVPQGLAGTIFPFAEGDLDTLTTHLEENKGEVAAIMMEPMRSNLPSDGYLEKVQELAKAYGVILIFDEVSCGWRMSIGGVQKYLGITPDMSVFAKCMSNGYAMGCVVGSKDVMQDADKMFISSSYWSDNIGLAASIATINELKTRNSETKFYQIGENLRAALNNSIQSTGISAHMEGIHTRPTISFDLPDTSLGPKVNTLFIQEMSKRGIYCATGFCATLSHTNDDIELTAKAAEESFKIILQGLEGSLDKLIETELKKEPFRRIVS